MLNWRTSVLGQPSTCPKTGLQNEPKRLGKWAKIGTTNWTPYLFVTLIPSNYHTQKAYIIPSIFSQLFSYSLLHLPQSRAQSRRQRFAAYHLKCLAQFIKQFGPESHLLVGKFDALRPYGIRRLGVGESHQTKINKIGTDGFLSIRLTKKKIEHKAQFCGILLLQAAVYKLVVLGI